MSIRLPLQTVLDYNQSTEVGSGPASVNGGVAKQFFIPQDTDNVVVKLSASVKGGGVSATFQTSDDGGITWYDVARTSVVSNAGATTGTAQWLSIPVVGVGVRTGGVAASVVATGSVQSTGSVYSATGSSAASSLGQLAVSGLPILGPNNRIFLQYTAAITSIISERVEVKVNSQSASA